MYSSNISFDAAVEGQAELKVITCQGRTIDGVIAYLGFVSATVYWYSSSVCLKGEASEGNKHREQTLTDSENSDNSVHKHQPPIGKDILLLKH